MDLKEITIAKVNQLGIEKAAEFFDKKVATIKGWLKTKNISADSLQKALDDHLTNEKGQQKDTVVAPVIGEHEILQRHEKVLSDVITYMNAKVVPFLEQEKAPLLERIGKIEAAIDWIIQPRPVPSMNGGQTVAQVLASDSAGNLGTSMTRPAAQTMATYSEPVGGGQARSVAHPLDSGIAPSAEQVQQSQNQTQGVAPGQPPARLAGPAVAVPGAEQFGPPGWTKPYPPRTR